VRAQPRMGFALVARFTVAPTALQHPRKVHQATAFCKAVISEFCREDPSLGAFAGVR
jgi:hypothetical protein